MPTPDAPSPLAVEPIQKPVEGFIARLNAHDWDGLADYLAERFVRVGGQAEVSTYSPTEYVNWVKEVLRGVDIYGKIVRRIVYSSDGTTAFADLIEFTGRAEGDRRESAALYAFDLDERGRIRRMALYQMPMVPEEPAVK